MLQPTASLAIDDDEFAVEYGVMPGPTTAVLEEKINGLSTRIDDRTKFFGWFAGVLVTVLLAVLAPMYQKLDKLSESVAAIRENQSKSVTTAVKALVNDGSSRENIDAAKALVAVARKQSFHSNPKALDELKFPILSAVEKSPAAQGSWQLAAEYISYRSENSFPADQLTRFRKLPPCTSQQPMKGVRMRLPHSGPIEKGEALELLDPAVFKGCQATLDDPALSAVVPEVAAVIFVDCLIRYRGGAVTVDARQFSNCAFEIDIPVLPPASGMSLAKRLLQLPSAG